jgi:hypothetical protein
MLTRRPAKSLAVAALMLAIDDPAGGFLSNCANRSFRSSSGSRATFSPSSSRRSKAK